MTMMHWETAVKYTRTRTRTRKKLNITTTTRQERKHKQKQHLVNDVKNIETQVLMYCWLHVIIKESDLSFESSSLCIIVIVRLTMTVSTNKPTTAFNFTIDYSNLKSLSLNITIRSTICLPQRMFQTIDDIENIEIRLVEPSQWTKWLRSSRWHQIHRKEKTDRVREKRGKRLRDSRKEIVRWTNVEQIEETVRSLTFVFSRCTLEIDSVEKCWLDESLTENQARCADSEYISFIFCPSNHIEILV